MKTIPLLNTTLTTMGSDVIVHREDNGTECPCLTPEGFRDMAWHREHPSDPVCNEQGMLTVAVEQHVKAAVQPANARGFTRVSERADQLLGDVQSDDKIGIFPVTWNGQTLDFTDWSEAGEDFVLYDGERYLVVAYDKVPDIDGDPNHHWEVGLRLLKTARPT